MDTLAAHAIPTLSFAIDHDVGKQTGLRRRPSLAALSLPTLNRNSTHPTVLITSWRSAILRAQPATAAHFRRRLTPHDEDPTWEDAEWQ